MAQSKSLYTGYLKRKMWSGGDWTGIDDGYSGMMGDKAIPDKQEESGQNIGLGMGQSGSPIGGGGGMGASIVDAGINLGSTYISNFAGKRKNPNSTYTPAGQFMVQKSAQGVQNGWNIGNKIYPGIGGMVGAFAGGIYGAFQGKKLDKEALEQRAYQGGLQKSAMYADMRNRAANLDNSPNFQNYYKYGGNLHKNFLANQKTLGGSISPMSKNTGIAVGPSHEKGGIGLPAQGAEVEGGETFSGSYVFSDKLGLASLHKPIARSKGKIEAKAPTPERLTSLKLLEGKEETLKLHQEYLKKALNLR